MTSPLGALPFFILATLIPMAPAADENSKKPAQGARFWLYVGTYTGDTSKGIYRLEFDSKDGTLKDKTLVAETTNPSFLAFDPTRKFLFAVNEVVRFQDKDAGAISSYIIDAKTGDLTFINQKSSRGTVPCHLTVDKEGKHVLAANYGSGSACVLPIKADGELGEACAFVQHQGFSVNKDRQEGPHAHSINLDPANRFAFVADLGLDKVLIYRYDAAKGTLTPHDPRAVTVAPGSGPRHFTFHPNGHFAYAINELKSTITAFAYDADKGTLQEIQTISALPADFKGSSGTAEVVIHPNGKFLYGSNRGHDSIAVFHVDPSTGKLTAKGHQAKGIKTPRNFVIDPTSNWLLVANQDSDSVIVFRIDPASGELKPTNQRADVGKPVCLRFLPISATKPK